MIESEQDAELAVRARRGEADCFEPLVARYERVLFNVALRMVGSYEDARDVTQTTFLKAYERLDSYDAKQPFFPWVYRIAMNESINLLRRRRPHEPLDPEAVAPGRSPEEQAQASEVGARVQAALMALTPPGREVVVLRHFVGLSYAEMGELLGVAEKTVKSRLFSARRRLETLLLERSANR